MKLNSRIRERIVDAVLADLPQRDFKAEAEAIVLPAVLERVPSPVQRAWKDNASRPYVRTASCSTNCGALSAHVPHYRGYLYGNEAKDAMGLEAWAALQALCGEHRKYRDERKALKARLAANLSACTTRKAFIERFPELAKYAPNEAAAPVANLPATTELIDSLKAAGLKIEEQA